MRDKQLNMEDRVTQPMEAGGWVSQFCCLYSIFSILYLHFVFCTLLFVFFISVFVLDNNDCSGFYIAPGSETLVSIQVINSLPFAGFISTFGCWLWNVSWLSKYIWMSIYDMLDRFNAQQQLQLLSLGSHRIRGTATTTTLPNQPMYVAIGNYTGCFFHWYPP